MEIVPGTRRFHADGLEIVTLAYEFTDDSAYNRSRAKLYKQQHGVPWDVIAVDGGVDKAGEILPSALTEVEVSGFPIALFIDRKFDLRGVRAGFPNPSASAEHALAVDGYERLAQQIMGPVVKRPK